MEVPSLRNRFTQNFYHNLDSFSFFNEALYVTKILNTSHQEVFNADAHALLYGLMRQISIQVFEDSQESFENFPFESLVERNRPNFCSVAEWEHYGRFYLESMFEPS